MLTDPCKFYKLSALAQLKAGDIEPGTVGDLAIVEQGAGGVVRRNVSINGCEALIDRVTIRHSVSNENAGQKTDRVAVRADQTVILSDGRPATAQATLTISSPRDGFDLAAIIAIVDSLLGFVVQGSTDLADGWTFTTPVSLEEYASLKRVLRGEG